MTKGIERPWLNLEAAAGIELKLQPERRGAGESQHHRLAPCRAEPLFLRLAHEMRAVAVGEHQSGLAGNDLAGEVRRHGEIEPVAMGQVLGPFAVGLKVEQARLDLDDLDVARPATGHHVGAPAVGERKLGHN